MTRAVVVRALDANAPPAAVNFTAFASRLSKHLPNLLGVGRARRSRAHLLALELQLLRGELRTDQRLQVAE